MHLFPQRVHIPGPQSRGRGCRQHLRHDLAAVLLCPAREVREIRLEIIKHTYSSAREDISLFTSPLHSWRVRGHTFVHLVATLPYSCVLREQRWGVWGVGGEGGVRPDSKNMCSGTHLFRPRARILGLNPGRDRYYPRL